ncbi:MAG: hypothetical protein F4X99_17355, partial [Gammaproteobacteria bacterium]|nr:hypothetical protein [Gammaproteobacteria bacterium]
YYSQVVGLDPSLAGFALLLALVFDAVSDPLVGRWSDRVRTRLGRRHPFLYAAVVPVAVCYYCLWVPPELSEAGTFAWLLAFTIGLRLSLTMHSVPFNALLPELAPDYDERTRLMNYSVSAAWFFGTLISVAMYAWWLADTPEYPDGAGVLRREGYEDAGLVAAIAICVCYAVAAAATHRHIPALARPPRRGPARARPLAEIVTTLRDRNLVVLVASAMLGAAAGGTSSALWAYMQPWFWGLDSDGIRTILAAQLLAPPIAIALLPRVIQGSDKKARLIQLSVLAIFVVCGPVFLELVGAFPPGDHPFRFPLLVVLGVAQVVLAVMTSALGASMLADVVDARAVAVGRREEGIVMATLSFVGKVAGGMGVWMGGLVLTVIDFPTAGEIATLDREMTARLGWWYAPLLTFLYVASVAALRFYRLSRGEHLEHLTALSEPKPGARAREA